MDYKNIARNFGILERRSRSFVAIACKRWNISFSEYVILEKIYAYEGCSQEELAILMMSDKSMVARSVKSLENKKIIIRKRDKKDKRLKCIYLTDYAWKIKPELDQVLKLWIDKLSENVNPQVVENVIASIHVAAKQAADVDVNIMNQMVEEWNKDEN